jgi:tetratricopeptide (TPR) repeat protein
MSIVSSLVKFTKKTAVLLGCAFIFSGLAYGADLDRIGTFDFPTSASGEAQRHFELGVGYLHSFGMTQAQAEFRKAQEIDPDFAMAYWGEAFTYQHPFFGAIDPGPGEAMNRLAPTSAERLAKAPTEREKGFVRAAEAYSLTEGGMPERRRAWMNAMADLYEQYPDDDEVKAFYIVSMLSGATASGDARERINLKAGAMALQLFKKNDNHPGAAHYVIHSFDDPMHAPIALEAASKYRDIAPAVSHARHMPTHIFIQHGMWEEVSQWNESAFSAAEELWKPGDRVGDQNHSSDWGQYGDLQLGDLERSKLWMTRAERVIELNPGDGRSMGTLQTMRARHIVESEQWQIQPITDDLSSAELLALGLSAVNLGDMQVAGKVAARLDELLAESPNSVPLQLVSLEIKAAILIKESRANGRASMAKQNEGLELVRNAVELTSQQRPPNGGPTPVKAGYEFAGEQYLAVGDYEEAVSMFETSLLRMPNRPLSLLGAARAYAGLDDSASAVAAYKGLLANWAGAQHPSVAEAKEYISQH